MKDIYGLSAAKVPAAYFQLLIDILVEQGISIEQIQNECKVPKHFTLSENVRLSTKQWTRLIINAIELTGDEGLGCLYGSRVKITSHGVMGFALLSSSTVKEAFDLLSQFFNMRIRGYHIDIKIINTEVCIKLKENHPIVGLSADKSFILQRFLHEAVLLACVEGLKFLTEKPDLDITLGFPWEKPKYFDKYAYILTQAHFNQLYTFLSFPVTFLSYPIASGNPIAYQFALEQCQKENLNFPATRLSKYHLADRIKPLLILEPKVGYPSLTSIAKSLNMSERSLKRYLEMEGSSYLILLNCQKETDAIRMLKETYISIQYISEYLGYSSSINFSRAFKRWTGKTPSQYRGSKV